MTDDPTTPLEADLDWVRRTLAPADPVRAVDRQPAPIPASLTGAPRLEPPRRRSGPMLVTAVAAVAALIVGVVFVVTGGLGNRTRHPSGPGGAAAVLAAYDTTVGAQSAEGRASLSLGGTSITVDGVGDLRTGQAVLTVLLPAPLGQVEVRSTGQDYFVHLPARLVPAAGGRPWVRIDSSTLQTLLGNQLGASGLGTSLDFNGALAWLRGVSGQVTTVGPESINGTPTTHYRAQVNVSRVAATEGADSQAASALAQAVGRTIPVDVWIDAQGRLRQLRVSLDVTSLRHQGVTLSPQVQGPAVLTVDLWNFGVTVHAVAPPANEVADASSLLAGRAGTG